MEYTTHGVPEDSPELRGVQFQHTAHAQSPLDSEPSRMLPFALTFPPADGRVVAVELRRQVDLRQALALARFPDDARDIQTISSFAH